MKDTLTVHKWLWAWEFEKEEDWLNEMAMKGWTLYDSGFMTYRFEKTEPGEYIIRLELTDGDPEYISFLEETGAEQCGKYFRWRFFRRKASEGPFDLFSDIDSRIEHLNRIAWLLTVVGFSNIAVGIANSINSTVHLGWINLLCAALIMYGVGRIHGKKEALEKERKLHE